MKVFNLLVKYFIHSSHKYLSNEKSNIHQIIKYLFSENNVFNILLQYVYYIRLHVFLFSHNRNNIIKISSKKFKRF